MKESPTSWLEALGIFAAISGTIGLIVWLNITAIALWWHANWWWIITIVAVFTSRWWLQSARELALLPWSAFTGAADFIGNIKDRNEVRMLLASVRTRLDSGHDIEYSNAVTGIAFKAVAQYIESEEGNTLSIPAPKEDIPSIVDYSSIADRVPADRSLLGIHPDTGELEIVNTERYKTAWFVGGSNTGKTNTVYGKVADAVRWGARMIICDSHANKNDSLANKLKDFHGRLLTPIAQTDDQIKDAIVMFLRQFKARRDQGASCLEKWLLVADEVNATANHIIRISKEEAQSLLEEFGIKIEGEFVKLQVFFKFLAETCGYEARGFEMFGYFISQKVAGLSWLRNAMMTVFVHGLLMDSEAFLAANNSRKMADLVKAFKVGRTLVYGLDFDPVILQQPKYSIGQAATSINTCQETIEDEYFMPVLKQDEVEFDDDNLQAQKNGESDERIGRIILLMLEGKSINSILKDEWGVSGGGGAYQAALVELREIQKTIAKRAMV